MQRLPGGGLRSSSPHTPPDSPLKSGPADSEAGGISPHHPTTRDSIQSNAHPRSRSNPALYLVCFRPSGHWLSSAAPEGLQADRTGRNSEPQPFPSVKPSEAQGAIPPPSTVGAQTGPARVVAHRLTREVVAAATISRCRLREWTPPTSPTRNHVCRGPQAAQGSRVHERSVDRPRV